MKTGKLFWGLGIILLAVALLLDGLGVLAPMAEKIGDVSIFALFLVLLLLCHTLSKIRRGKIDDIFVPLALVFMLLEKNIAFWMGREDSDIVNNWLLLGCAVLMQIGFSILFSHSRIKVEIGDDGDVKIDADIEAETEVFVQKRKQHSCKRNCFSSCIRYIDAACFGRETIENDLASTVIRFENVGQYTGGGVLYIENNLGSTVVELPASWRFEVDIENSLGSVRYPSEKGDPSMPQVIIRGENNLGSVVIKYV